MASRLSQEEGDKFTTESKGGYAAEKVDRSLVVCDVNTPFRKGCSDATASALVDDAFMRMKLYRPESYFRQGSL